MSYDSFRTARVLIVRTLIGKPSSILRCRCPNNLISWPTMACECQACSWWVKSLLYKNCSFLASEVSEHSLSEIGEMMGISRERVRQLEESAIGKLMCSSELKEIHSGILYKQSLVKRRRPNPPKDKKPITENEIDLFQYFGIRDMG